MNKNKYKREKEGGSKQKKKRFDKPLTTAGEEVRIVNRSLTDTYSSCKRLSIIAFISRSSPPPQQMPNFGLNENHSKSKSKDILKYVHDLHA